MYPLRQSHNMSILAAAAPQRDFATFLSCPAAPGRFHLSRQSRHKNLVELKGIYARKRNKCFLVTDRQIGRSHKYWQSKCKTHDAVWVLSGLEADRDKSSVSILKLLCRLKSACKTASVLLNRSPEESAICDNNTCQVCQFDISDIRCQTSPKSTDMDLFPVRALVLQTVAKASLTETICKLAVERLSQYFVGSDETPDLRRSRMLLNVAAAEVGSDACDRGFSAVKTFVSVIHMALTHCDAVVESHKDSLISL